MLHACTMRDQSATTWDGLPGAARRVVTHTPFREGRLTNSLGARRSRVFFAWHVGMTKISIHIGPKITDVAASFEWYLKLLGNHWGHSSQRFGVSS